MAGFQERAISFDQIISNLDSVFICFSYAERSCCLKAFQEGWRPCRWLETVGTLRLMSCLRHNKPTRAWSRRASQNMIWSASRWLLGYSKCMATWLSNLSLSFSLAVLICLFTSLISLSLSLFISLFISIYPSLSLSVSSFLYLLSVYCLIRYCYTILYLIPTCLDISVLISLPLLFLCLSI